MDPREINKLAEQPGVEGALWRLIRMWDPDSISRWLATEKMRRSGRPSPEVVVEIVAEVMSGAAAVLAQRLSGDREGALFGERGLFKTAERKTRSKLDQVGGQHKIIVPNAAPGIKLNG